ncbi:PREDICTED: uncharacterized protein LOC104608533 isoform X2 [Nelumbo nucifera]|uniref:Uncharacterized protein LOC104608533 isoform X2 n=1 Tax=Nelumbo nucifera TaxID=4432 RepID=A0A1U8AXA9_NELNU|nr:PREDICTED: uncharacterized protein LOC104608533 isoform X2 [Nelumbo nucifera]
MLQLVAPVSWNLEAEAQLFIMCLFITVCNEKGPDIGRSIMSLDPLIISRKPSSTPSPPFALRFRDSRKLRLASRCSPHPRLRFRLVVQSLGNRWKLNDIDIIPERLNLWLLKTQSFLNGVAHPIVRTRQVRKPDIKNAMDSEEIEEIFIAEQTIERRTPKGNLSLTAIVSIEQFSRMNGMTGKIMQKIFEELVPESVRNDARNLVEYCCFRFLSRDSSDIHPCLKMKLVREEAFVRIAPAVAGLADRLTVYSLYKALAGEEQGISLSSWTMYIEEILKVHEGRKSYQTRETPILSDEQILCVGSSSKQPVLKWENSIAWPGKLILTDKALYFEAVGLINQKEASRLDLTRHGSRVEKARVGPLGCELFDSAVSVSSGPQSETWLLEFVEFGGEMRRDLWHAFISELIALHEFIREYGPEDGDQSVNYVYGSHKGKTRATISAINSVARLQALHFIQKLSEDPAKLVQFAYLRNTPNGYVVCQALAVNFWGGPLVKKFAESDHVEMKGTRPSNEVSGSIHVFDIDGSVYLQKWMKSPSWATNASVTFWKNSSIRQGLVLNKNLVVSDMTLVEKAAITCKEKSQVIEKTQATIDAAMLKGIPSNIDLFKELMLPFVVVANNFEKLRHWEEPHLTVSFLAVAYTIIFRNLLSYAFPVALMILAAVMLLLKELKEQGRLGRSFGKIIIHDQPPSSTIQKIIALKEAMIDLENYLQNLNVALLKIRTIFLPGQPQITAEVSLVLLAVAFILLVVPFRFVLAFLLLDLFTRELGFRREMVIRFSSFLKERWDSVPAAPVVILPFESDKAGSADLSKAIDGQGQLEITDFTQKSRPT